MTVHTCPDPNDFATRFHNLHVRAGEIRRQLSAASNWLRCYDEVDLNAIAKMRAEAAALVDEAFAFLDEMRS